MAERYHATNKPFTPSVVMPNAVMLTVVASEQGVNRSDRHTVSQRDSSQTADSKAVRQAVRQTYSKTDIQ